MQSKYMIKQTFALVALVCLVSCKKESFVNLTATLSWQSGSLEVEEGQYIGTDLNLNTELSEDLYLKVRLDTDGIENYINPEDFSPHFEYSDDNGQHWIQGTTDQVIFRSKTRMLRIRKRIIDDDKLELHERFRWKLEPQSINNLQISGTFDPITVKVKDNESNDLPPGDESFVFGALFSIDAQQNFKLISLNRGADFPKRLKMMVDEGSLAPEIKDDFLKLIAIGGVPIIRFDAYYDSSAGGIQGYTIFDFLEDREGELGMGMNLALGYDGDNGVFNETGFYGYVLTHEYGHAMTLNEQYEVNTTIDSDACNNFYYERYGCFNEKSAFNQFNKQFYESKEGLVKPLYVTNYAASDIAEDIAESFAYGISQEDLPPLVEGSSTALQKVYQVNAYDRFIDFRQKIRGIMNLSIPERDEEIRGYVNTRRHDGHVEPISCLDHQTLWEEYQKNLKAKR